MVKIRLRKTGCNRVATFRVVACDSRSPRDGKFGTRGLLEESGRSGV